MAPPIDETVLAAPLAPNDPAEVPLSPSTMDAPAAPLPHETSTDKRHGAPSMKVVSKTLAKKKQELGCPLGTVLIKYLAVLASSYLWSVLFWLQRHPGLPVQMSAFWYHVLGFMDLFDQA